MPGSFTLTKEERISSRRLIEQLFDKAGKRSVVAFPLRAVYLILEDRNEEPAVQMMVSVPKRLLHRAVWRNRVKRQVREAYRKNKIPLVKAVEQVPDRKLAVGFVWLDKQVGDSKMVESCVCRLMDKIQRCL